MNARATTIVAVLAGAVAIAACTTTANFDYGGGPDTSAPTSMGTGSVTGTGTGTATPTPVVVQHAISTPSSASSITLTLPSAVTVGDVLVVTASCASTTSITSVSDSAGNTWAVAGTMTFGSSEPMAVWWAKVATAGPAFTITVTDGAADSEIKALAVEINGVSSPGKFAGSAGGGTTISTGSVVVSAGTLAFSTTVVKAATTLTALDGSTLIDHGLFGSETFGDEARRAVVTTSVRCSFSDLPSGSWGCARICFAP